MTAGSTAAGCRFSHHDSRRWVCIQAVSLASSSATSTTGHVGDEARLLGLDAARGVALLGMMAVHALLLVDDDGNPTTAFTLAAGRSAALFAVPTARPSATSSRSPPP